MYQVQYIMQELLLSGQQKIEITVKCTVGHRISALGVNITPYMEVRSRQQSPSTEAQAFVIFAVSSHRSVQAGYSVVFVFP